jgi:hypothetical protein
LPKVTKKSKRRRRLWKNAKIGKSLPRAPTILVISANALQKAMFLRNA